MGGPAVRGWASWSEPVGEYSAELDEVVMKAAVQKSGAVLGLRENVGVQPSLLEVLPLLKRPGVAR